MRIFDRRLHAMRRSRAALRYGEYSFLKQRAAEDIAERLDAINRSFGEVLDVGSHDGCISKALTQSDLPKDRVGNILTCDLSPAFAELTGGVCVDEEALPFASETFDLAVSALSLHWVNDLPGALIQICHVLKPDGLFIGAVFGGRTLNELRSCLTEAEEEVRGGAAPRVSPFLDMQDGARLLQRAGFAMPVSDTDVVTVRYDNMFRLLADLRGMGETASFADRRAPPLTRTILARATQIYAERVSDPDGRIRATFEIVSMSGWAPSPDQPKPKRPGSATTRLADALGTKEISAGETTGRPGKPDEQN